MPNKKKWTPRRLKKLVELIENGYTPQEVADYFGITRNNLNQTCWRYGIRFKPESTSKVVAEKRLVRQFQNDPISVRTSRMFGTKAREGKTEDIPSKEELRQTRLSGKLSDFAEKYVRFDGVPLKLDEKQKEIVDSDSKLEIWNKSARVGITFAMALRAFLRSIFYPGIVSLFVSIKEARAREILQDYIINFASSFAFEGSIQKVRDEKIIFAAEEGKNGSVIYSLTTSPSGVRGIPQGKGTEVYLDEFAHYRAGLDEKMWQALSRVLPLGGNFRIWSTPHLTTGTYFEVWNKANPEHEEYNGFERKIFNWRDCSRITKEQVDEYKKAVGPLRADCEFENKFINLGDAYFPEPVVDECMSTAKHEFTPSLPTYVGIDFAMGGEDETAVVVTQRGDDDFFYVIEAKTYSSKITQDQIMGIVRRLINLYKPVKIRGDMTGMGIPIIEKLKEQYGSIIEGVPFSSQQKEYMITSLWNIIHNRAILIPRNNKLKNQLVNLQMDKTPTGALRFNAAPGFHDDLVWALSLSISTQQRRWTGLLASEVTGQYQSRDKNDPRSHEDFIMEKVLAEQG